MTASAPIRPMDATLDGYAWLPRMIDKARAARAGTLGDLVHPCPVDRRALKHLGLSFEAFGAVIDRTEADDEVLAELRALGIPSAREAWFDAPAWEDALQEMAWNSEGEMITARAERDVLILATTPALTVTFSRYVTGERGPDLHLHQRHVDAFFLLSGTMRFQVGEHGERVIDAPAGTLVVAPALVGHSFHNPFDDEVTWLNVHAPDAGFAEFLRTGADFDSEDMPRADGTRGLPAHLVTVVSGEAYTYFGSGFALTTDGFRAEVTVPGTDARVSYCLV